MFERWWTRRSARRQKRLEARIAELEAAVSSMRETPYRNHIEIDTLHIHDPVLEKLEFRLDQLDIDEVSGALNLGNNFGVRVLPKVGMKGTASGVPSTAANNTDTTNPTAGSDSSTRFPNGQFDKTNTGYHVAFRNRRP